MLKIIAIEGRAAAGKSTLAARLATELKTSVIKMDDFFLPPQLRTKERLDEIGGNIHYERFLQEVLPYIKERKSFSYRIFDCSIFDYNGKREIPDTPVRIVEGSYSLHPVFGNYADVRIFCDISPVEQMARIIKRNGEEKAKIFAEKWIPLEEKYFKMLDF